MMNESQDLDTALWEMNKADPIHTTEYTGRKEERKEAIAKTIIEIFDAIDECKIEKDFNDDEIFD